MKIEKGKIQVRVWENAIEEKVYSNAFTQVMDLLLLLQREDADFEGILDENTGNYISREELENVKDSLNCFVDEPLWTLQ